MTDRELIQALRSCQTGRIFDGFIEVQRSECEETHLFDAIRLETAARYCPYCGVKWDGGDHHERN